MFDCKVLSPFAVEKLNTNTKYWSEVGFCQLGLRYVSVFVVKEF